MNFKQHKKNTLMYSLFVVITCCHTLMQEELGNFINKQIQLFLYEIPYPTLPYPTTITWTTMNDWLSRKKTFLHRFKIVLVCFLCGFGSYLLCGAFINITVDAANGAALYVPPLRPVVGHVSGSVSPRLLLQFCDRRVSRGGLKLRSWRRDAYRGGVIQRSPGAETWASWQPFGKNGSSSG